MPQNYKEVFPDGLVRVRTLITAAEVVAIGASTTGSVALGYIVPAGSYITRVRCQNGGTVAATLATLTMGVGDAGDVDEMLDEGTVHAANASVETAPLLPFAAKDATWTPVASFIGDANLSTLTGASPGGFEVFIEYRTLQS